MNHHQPLMWAAMLACLTLSPMAAQAAERAPQSPSAAASGANALSPAQLTAIRGISRNVLAAKKSGAEEGDDAAQLSSLRAGLDQLIGFELEPMDQPSITPQGQQSEGQGRARAKIAHLREAARLDGRAMVAQLRRHGDLKALRASGTPEGDTGSARLSIDEQRVQLFVSWAQKLDAALADGNENRTADLLALRDQLQATRGSVTDAQPTRGTPTLQAMPAGFVPQKLLNQEPTQDDGAAKP